MSIDIILVNKVTTVTKRAKCSNIKINKEKIMKKVKVQVVGKSEVVHFKNDGKITGAPLGATIAARTKAANVTVSPSGIVTTWLGIEIKSPTGQMINLRINDSQVINVPVMMEVEIPALYEIGNFECKGALIEGYVEKVVISNAYSPYDTQTISIITEEGKSYDNCVIATNHSNTVWGQV